MIEKEAEHRNTATPPIVLCGNKADIPDKRKITSAQAQEKAQQWNAICTEDFRCAFLVRSVTAGLLCSFSCLYLL
jgi:hypothetical protein